MTKEEQARLVQLCQIKLMQMDKADRIEQLLDGPCTREASSEVDRLSAELDALRVMRTNFEELNALQETRTDFDAY